MRPIAMRAGASYPGCRLRHGVVLIGLVAAAAVLAGCGGSKSAAPEPTSGSFRQSGFDITFDYPKDLIQTTQLKFGTRAGSADAARAARGHRPRQHDPRLAVRPSQAGDDGQRRGGQARGRRRDPAARRDADGRRPHRRRRPPRLPVPGPAGRTGRRHQPPVRALRPEGRVLPELPVDPGVARPPRPGAATRALDTLALGRPRASVARPDSRSARRRMRQTRPLALRAWPVGLVLLTRPAACVVPAVAEAAAAATRRRASTSPSRSRAASTSPTTSRSRRAPARTRSTRLRVSIDDRQPDHRPALQPDPDHHREPRELQGRGRQRDRAACRQQVSGHEVEYGGLPGYEYVIT